MQLNGLSFLNTVDRSAVLVEKSVYAVSFLSLVSKYRAEWDMQTILVLGSWSSGTTAVTGYIQRLGAYSCPPHWLLNDPRTPDTYESVEFREILIKCINEHSFTPSIPEHTKVFKDFIRAWFPAKQAEAKAIGVQAIVLKNPLAAFFLNEINEICSPKYLLVTRGLKDIENTRFRRRWVPTYGQQGAKVIYSVIFDTLIKIEKSFHAISYYDFLYSESERGKMREYLAIKAADNYVDRAEGWIRHD